MITLIDRVALKHAIVRVIQAERADGQKDPDTTATVERERKLARINLNRKLAKLDRRHRHDFSRDGP